ncbi:hypothetical protein CYMTET_49601 [Cymbomonas tetramitiformis]|uniref:Uncharacterized protein n=1 Tax=Cymbomonas tetramitiformis TaxID=36881 RepID=A0AAE0BR24_9CHLO|nr:hypothetical protein CYMTET_49601 [Cymbomonas tetramitiformis]
MTLCFAIHWLLFAPLESGAAFKSSASSAEGHLQPHSRGDEIIDIDVSRIEYRTAEDASIELDPAFGESSVEDRPQLADLNSPAHISRPAVKNASTYSVGDRRKAQTALLTSLAGRVKMKTSATLGPPPTFAHPPPRSRTDEAGASRPKHTGLQPTWQAAVSPWWGLAARRRAAADVAGSANVAGSGQPLVRGLYDMSAGGM